MTATADVSHAREVLAHAVVEDPEAGIYRANRRIFTDEEIFELEMAHIFEGNWIYLAHESQLPNPGDYFTTYIGRQPVVITRDEDGDAAPPHQRLRAPRRDALPPQDRQPDHAHLPVPRLDLPQRRQAAQGQGPRRRRLPCRPSTATARTTSPRSRGSTPTAASCSAASTRTSFRCREHLGDTTKVIDMLVDQSPDGLEVLRGSSTYTFDGNWKVQAENGADGYHVTATHWNYAATTARRDTGESKNQTKALDAGSWGKSGGGYWSYPNGHLCLWTWAANPQDRPLWDRMDELKEQFGEAKGEFMVKGCRNLCLYPNVYLMDQFSTQIRHFRPIAPDKTEVTIYCIAPKGESAQARAHRIRQYEDFFNASGMATPDDLEEFRSCQLTFQATAAPWNDMSRGAEHWLTGPDEVGEVARAWTASSPPGCETRTRACPRPARLLAGHHPDRDRGARHDDHQSRRPRSSSPRT